ncbi:ChaN family lipoprotein [Spirabiliibacterium falconis]|uniref:ChaN family lipoprotein n=1 Tax=Spirabiliibacterium falconis TaxID=572023 RepID=UPI001AAD355B|nr:ChaN family lipoprotein [Spirabiliibacterium falconis]MBE2894245.1 hypothetical protein [Spirabiliibacterium falconis]
MKWISLAFISFVTVLLSSCAHKHEIYLHEKTVFDTAQQRYITVEAMLQQLQQRDLVLLGEVHDNPKHHLAELFLVKQLQTQPKGLHSVMLEMLTTEQNAKLLAAQVMIQREHITDAQDIATLIQWNPKWNWRLYHTLVSFIARSRTHLIGANLTQDEINTIMQGAYPLNGQQSTQDSVKAQLADIITQTHGKLDNSTLAALVSVQQFKDRRMAQTLVENTDPKTGIGLLIAGRFHVSKFMGVPLHLNDYGKHNYAVVMMSDSHTAMDSREADFIWEIK